MAATTNDTPASGRSSRWQLRWYVILCAVLLWLVITVSALIYAISWQQNSQMPTLPIPTGTDICSRDFVLQSWIYDFNSSGGSNSCPPSTNGVIVINNVLYHKPLLRNDNCCYFSETNLVRVTYPPIYIGQTATVFTDVELNTKPYLVNITKTSYSYYCPVCTEFTYQLVLVGDNRYSVAELPNYAVYFGADGYIISITRNAVVVAERSTGTNITVYDMVDRTLNDLAAINNKSGFQPLAVAR